MRVSRYRTHRGRFPFNCSLGEPNSFIQFIWHYRFSLFIFKTLNSPAGCKGIYSSAYQYEHKHVTMYNFLKSACPSVRGACDTPPPPRRSWEWHLVRCCMYVHKHSTHSRAASLDLTSQMHVQITAHSTIRDCTDAAGGDGQQRSKYLHSKPHSDIWLICCYTTSLTKALGIQISERWNRRQSALGIPVYYSLFRGHWGHCGQVSNDSNDSFESYNDDWIRSSSSVAESCALIVREMVALSD